MKLVATKATVTAGQDNNQTPEIKGSGSPHRKDQEATVKVEWDDTQAPEFQGSGSPDREDKMATLAARHDRDYVPVTENDRKHIIENQPDMAKYTMVYNQEPDTRALLLRFPNRRPDQPYSALFGQKPLEIRIKPKHGHVEIDIPVPIDHHWDVKKAIEYQHAMQKSTVLQKGGSYGLAGGLGGGAQPASKKKSSDPNQESNDQATTKGPSMETLLANPNDANNKGHVMNKITLAGRIFPFDDTQSRYLCGVFKDDVCYMSHVDAIVELTANFTHLDALNDLNKSTARHQRNTEKDEQEPEAKSVNLTVKSTEPEDHGMPRGKSEISQLLQDMADEPWQRMQWIDHDDDDSYQRFEEHFGFDKGIDHLPELISPMTPQQWLDVMSCPRYDYTTKSYREMTFPKKGEKDPKLQRYDPRLAGYINGTTGYIDADGWEWVDPDAPNDPRFIYEEVPRSEIEGEHSDNEDDEDDQEGSVWEIDNGEQQDQYSGEEDQEDF
ncbi:MAG: hypothetical protein Q9166_003885 [cf. Caloplaca sp. 2 TL-2023]